MEAKVIRWGDDLAVRLSSAEAEQLGIREGGTVEIVSKEAVQPEPPQWVGRRYIAGQPVYTPDAMVAEMDRLGPDFAPPTVDWGPDRGAEIIDDDDSPLIRRCIPGTSSSPNSAPFAAPNRTGAGRRW